MGALAAVAVALWCVSIPAIVLCLAALGGDASRRLREQTDSHT